MIVQELKRVCDLERSRGMSQDYIKNALKEYLQVYVLSFVYTSPRYNKEMIFTGGTCLRHFYELPRLSEDVDFDYTGELDTTELADGLREYFRVKYKYDDASISIKQQGRQILLKFPVLEALNLRSTGGSDLLYVKMDAAIAPSQNFKTIVSSQSRYGLNYVARHYDLPDLMAGKLHAILMRRFLRGRDDREAARGRDYFDLLWFLKKGVRPNMQRLSDMLGEKISAAKLRERLNAKVAELSTKLKDFRSDMSALVENSDALALYVENYREEYERNVSRSIGDAE